MPQTSSTTAAIPTPVPLFPYPLFPAFSITCRSPKGPLQNPFQCNHLPQSQPGKPATPPGPVPSIVPAPHESNRTVPNLPRPDWKSNVTQAS
jgi:hypothetical protein